MITLNNIHFNYKKGKSLFRNLNLVLEPGHIYGLLGKNGAGKSTLLKHVSGLLFPSEGDCKVLNFAPEDRAPEMLQDIYLIPEEFELPPVSASTYAKVTAPFYPKFSFEELKNHMAEFEIADQVKLSTLSYGQKKKFLIAFGLATNARVLILDEPTNGLDIPSKSQFRKIMASALTDERIIIISTHQVRDLENLIDTVVVLENGQIIFNRSTVDISERLSFEHNLNGIPGSDILYAEELSGKKAGIVKNLSGIETRIDLELLFNGIIKNNNVINGQFSK
ncbi:MAG TPA: ABC transporter ATP-binding protein [Cytophagales bacterium]|nr:ABC transporter ATP-binding protein [Cytophagales bacterium]